jgi:uncharacterized protein (DUF486 family)
LQKKKGKIVLFPRFSPILNSPATISSVVSCGKFHYKMLMTSTPPLWPVIRTTLLLIMSNCFMTTAWYGHLRFKSAPMWIAILASWSIALLEYAFQVPANRLGYGAMTAYQLKILQEAIALSVFVVFAWLVLGETPSPRYIISFLMVFGGIAVAFYK